MKSVLFLALAVALTSATTTLTGPTVAKFDYLPGDWLKTNWNIFVLSIIMPFYALVGYFAALFGASQWFNTAAFTLISETFELSAYKYQSFDLIWEMLKLAAGQ